MRLYCLIVTTLLLCAASALCLTGQTTGSNERVPSADVPAEAGSVVPSSAAYAGNTECKTCHPTIWATFYKNPHFKSLASGTYPLPLSQPYQPALPVTYLCYTYQPGRPEHFPHDLPGPHGSPLHHNYGEDAMDGHFNSSNDEA